MLFLSDAQTAGSGAVGFCDPETQTIGVVNSQANDALQDTFLHEVLHAICHVMGLRETEKEENFVRRLVAGLCTVRNHNHAFLVSMGIALGYFFFLPHGHGLANEATAQLSHRSAIRLRRLGCFSARLFNSVRSALMSYNSQGPVAPLATSFHLP